MYVHTPVKPELSSKAVLNQQVIFLLSMLMCMHVRTYIYVHTYMRTYIYDFGTRRYVGIIIDLHLSSSLDEQPYSPST